ncbi:MAG: sensor domain-containing diguanylate cyclase, partial [Acidimicrobiia bacterium]|nr:sensor domain-containing diguanylate cyclase [Acidimicrobiia bacterium]
PTALVAAYLAGAGAALVVHRHQRPTKLCFNLAHFALGAVLAEVVFHGLVGHGGTPHDVGTGTWLPLVAAAFMSALVGVVAVQTVIGLSQGHLPDGDVEEVAVLGGVATVVNASLGIVAVSLAWDHPANAWALAVPLVIVVVAYRAYLAERDKRTGLQFLYQSAQLLQGTQDVADATTWLLVQTCAMFRAELAELVLFPGGDGSRALRASVDVEGNVQRLGRGQLDAAELVLASLASDRRGVFVHGGRAVTKRRRVASNRTPVDGMVATLDNDSAIIGMLRVVHRLDTVSAFDHDELRLLQTLANHVATALANGQLEQSLRELRAQEKELRHQALHDPLTGLANRSLFAERLREAVDDDDSATAVVFIDLDDFKIVNDSFGHPAGDEVLRQTAARIRDCLRPSDTAARLGGDEFAVLLREVPDGERAMAVAERIRDAVEAPVAAGAHIIVVGASLGVSLGTAGEARIDDMLERADAAMYRVKASGKGAVQLVETGRG